MSADKRYEESVRQQVVEVFEGAFARGPAAVTGRPAISADEVRRAGIPAVFTNEIQEDFAELGGSASVNTLARRWASRVVTDSHSDEARDQMIAALTGKG